MTAESYWLILQPRVVMAIFISSLGQESQIPNYRLQIPHGRIRKVRFGIWNLQFVISARRMSLLRAEFQITDSTFQIVRHPRFGIWNFEFVIQRASRSAQRALDPPATENLVPAIEDRRLARRHCRKCFPELHLACTVGIRPNHAGNRR